MEVYSNDNCLGSPSPLELLCRLMENTRGHAMIGKVNKMTSKDKLFDKLHDVNS